MSLIKILARLAEAGCRELEKETGYSSLFMFCVKDLGYSEAAAHYRTKAAKACVKFPALLERLQSGELHVKAVALLEPHLNRENFERLTAQAKGASQRELDRMVAGLSPEAKPTERVRVIAVPVPPPAASPDSSASDSPAPAGDAPPEPVLETAAMIELRTEHRFTVEDRTEAKIVRARELLAHKFPMGDMESIVDAALDALLDRIDPERRKARPDAEPRAPEEQTRRVPEWVKKKVRARDGHRCAYISPGGIRCGERLFLQFDHMRPWSRGGRSDDPGNIRQVCASHNQWLARRMRADAFWIEVKPRA